MTFMRLIFFQSIICILFLVYSCAGINPIHRKINTVEIIKIDSVDIYYIFTLNTKDSTIVLGEIDYLKPCFPFKKYLLKDSIKQTMNIKEGSKIVSVKYLGYINDKKIKNTGELVKYIDSCDSFTD